MDIESIIDVKRFCKSFLMTEQFIPHMGTHLIMDFVGVQDVDLNSFEVVSDFMTRGIALSNAQIIGTYLI